MNYRNLSVPFLLIALSATTTSCREPGAGPSQQQTNAHSEAPASARTPVPLQENNELSELLVEAKNHIENYYGDSRELDAAAKLIKQILEKDEKFVPAYVQLARIVLKGGQIIGYQFQGGTLERATEILDYARKIDGAYSDTYVLSAYVYALKEEYKESHHQYDEAKRLNAQSPWLELNHAFTLQREQRLKEAFQIYNQYLTNAKRDGLERQNAYTFALTQLMVMSHSTGNREAVKFYAEQLVGAAQPTDAWARGNAASHLIGKGYFDQGIAYARQAIKIMPYGAVESTLAEGLYGQWAYEQSPGASKLDSPLLQEARQLRPDVKGMAQEFMGREGSAWKEIGARLYKLDEMLQEQNTKSGRGVPAT